MWGGTEKYKSAWQIIHTVVFVKSPSDRADEPVDPEVPKPTIFQETKLNSHSYANNIK